jgi:hypothetical protein
VALSSKVFTSAEWSRCRWDKTTAVKSFQGSKGVEKKFTKAPGPGSIWIKSLPAFRSNPPEFLILLKVTVLPPAVPKK